MAKRFIDTELFDDPWYMDLSKEAKLLWVYVITKCDHAGIISYNKKLWKFQTDIEQIETVIKELGNRLISVTEEYFFIPNYIKYQYPNFPNSKVKQQQSALEILNKFNININSYLTLKKPLIKGYDNDNDNDNDNISEKIIESNILTETCSFFGISEINQPRAFIEISKFINTLTHRNRIDYYINQFKYYKLLKKEAHQQVHNWQNYIGTVEDKQYYENGAWNIQDWEKKYNDYKNSLNINSDSQQTIKSKKLTSYVG